MFYKIIRVNFQKAQLNNSNVYGPKSWVSFDGIQIWGKRKVKTSYHIVLYIINQFIETCKDGKVYNIVSSPTYKTLVKRIKIINTTKPK